MAVKRYKKSMQCKWVFRTSVVFCFSGITMATASVTSSATALPPQHPPASNDNATQTSKPPASTAGNVKDKSSTHPAIRGRRRFIPIVEGIAPKGVGENQESTPNAASTATNKNADNAPATENKPEEKKNETQPNAAWSAWIPAPSHGKPRQDPEPQPAAEKSGDESKNTDGKKTEVLAQCEVKCPSTVQSGNIGAGFDGKPLAGYHGGVMYLRDRADYFRLYLGARVHLDSHHFAGPGVSDTNLTSSVLLRRAALRLRGEILSHWQWEMSVDFSPDEFTDLLEQEANYRAKPSSVYINYRFIDEVNLQLGQFAIPFMAGNLTSSNSTAFLERSLVVRSWGVPQNLDLGLMLWGNLPNDKVFWSAALLQGDGDNRLNVDRRGMFATRVFTKPLVSKDSAIKGFQVGASFQASSRDNKRVMYDYRSMTTQNGYAFWRPTYTDSAGTGQLIRIIPSGTQLAVAGELRIPFDRFDLQGEYVYVHNNTREAVDGMQHEKSERFGTMKGHAYHVTWAYWVVGQPFASGTPGNRKPLRMNLNESDESITAHGVEILLRWEQLFARYDSASRSGSPALANRDGKIRINTATFGVNYWAMDHLRVSFNYGLNMFPKASAATSHDQRAQAPGNRIDPGKNDAVRNSANRLHEFSTRVAVSF